MKAFRRWLMSFLAGSDYEGPATLDVFGHDEHIGWVRAGEERIDILTVKGEAIQVDVRARFRLTPITWQELSEQCLRQTAYRERELNQMSKDIQRLHERVDERDSRIEDLRKAIARARDEFKDFGDMDTISNALNEAIEVDERAADDEEFPF
jgi:hypothetical protein